MIEMKLIVVLFFIFGLCAALYIFLVHLKKINKKALIISSLFGIVLVALLGIAMYKSARTPDSWCSHFQITRAYPPMQTITAADWFEMGNYDYDTGNCKKAVDDYTKSLNLNDKYPQTYNNLAFTQMRMGNYKDALNNLNKALSLDPNYINALMNRGDIHNYYYEIDKSASIADYKKIISISGTKGTSVCGHLYLAEHGGWNLGTIFGLPFALFNCQ